jgi:small multidrug resistance family-3 protein
LFPGYTSAYGRHLGPNGSGESEATTMTTYFWYGAAAFGEIAGSFAFWAWLRLDKSVLWTIPGAILLILFAVALTRIDSVFAGRTFAAYGGVYIFSSLVWLWAVEGVRPDRWDVIGGLVCIAGALIILAGPRTAVA